MTTLAEDTVERQCLYGLNVESEVVLHQNRYAEWSGTPDVKVTRGETLNPGDKLPAEDCILEFGMDGEPWYSAYRTKDGGYLLDFHGTCRFVMSADLRDVSVHDIVGAQPGVSDVLTAGGMLAFQLYVREHTVLHGSAVQIGDGALAFVGVSGQGKSTMATLQCADGARLITDDVLRVDTIDDSPAVRLGATELRLRKGADSLAAQFEGGVPVARVSADDRQVLRLPDDADDRLPLRAIVIPIPNRVDASLHVEQLPKAEAGFVILNFARLSGWIDADIIKRHFQQVTTVLKSVPVFVARVPWGPPFAPDLAREIRTRVLGHGEL